MSEKFSEIPSFDMEKGKEKEYKLSDLNERDIRSYTLEFLGNKLLKNAERVRKDTETGIGSKDRVHENFSPNISMPLDGNRTLGFQISLDHLEQFVSSQDNKEFARFLNRHLHIDPEGNPKDGSWAWADVKSNGKIDIKTFKNNEEYDEFLEEHKDEMEFKEKKSYY